MSKLLLVHPLFLSKSPEEREAGSPYFPLGLLYLASYVRDNGHEVAVFDGTFKEDESAFVACLEEENPDVVGISAVLPTRDMALKLADLAWDANKPVVMGGPDATRDPIWYLAHPQVDIVGHHEGEQTMVALLDLAAEGNLLNPLFLKHELGIAYRDSFGGPIINDPRPPIENLDTLPMPARDLIDMDRYLNTWKEDRGYTSMTISTTRGCPYGCDWCADAVHGNQYRQRSPESVAQEMKMLRETFQIDRLRVVDDVDGIEREWIEDWAQAAEDLDAVIPFEGLNKLEREDIPMLDVRDDL
ncbi:MAG: cobalamin-dependent protein [Chloroflexota bacterium]